MSPQQRARIVERIGSHGILHPARARPAARPPARRRTLDVLAAPLTPSPFPPSLAHPAPMITAYSYAASGDDHRVLAPAWTPRGHTVVRTTNDLLEDIFDWPGNVYELAVDPRHVLEQGPRVLRVARYDVVRTVPRDSIFGPNVAQLDALLEELRTLPWLRPTGGDCRPRAAALVAEHYAALGHYGRVRPGPERILRDASAVQPYFGGSRKLADRKGLTARIQAHEAAVRAVDARLSPQLKLAVARIVSDIVVPGTWRAAWEHAATASLAFTLADWRRTDASILLDDTSASLIEHIGRALAAGMETGLERFLAMRAGDGAAAEHAAVSAALAVALAEIPAAWSNVKADAGRAITLGVVQLWTWARCFAEQAGKEVTWHALHLVADLREPDPWAPWVGLLRLGLWPLHDDGVVMTVYEPQTARE